MMGKSYDNESALNPAGDIVTFGGPVHVTQATDSDVPAPGSGAVLSTDGTSTSQLNVKTPTGTVGISPTGVLAPATAATFTVTQTAAPVDTAGAPLTIKSQAGGAKSKTADGAGGNIVLQTGEGGGEADAGTFTVKVGSNTMFGAAEAGLTLPNGLTWTQSDATPEGAVAAPVGSLHTDKTAGKLYMKTSGTGNTGWSGMAFDV